ncbi:type II secretion system F family protein [Candidatus Albibeggiatoa sp. nov. NOAA]|uniref:type II secretion system F family protein n=1 Tax=Candidatus Albibeggiatoa sp. nov. NOAA TaxID=3162724 RepID=UPI0032FBFCA1|nr:type II secretion system F family protein [Thiotrichaceae bacterium]
MMKYRQTSDIALLFNELAILLESGVDVSEALHIIQTEPDPALKSVVPQLTKAVDSGASLSEALAKQPEAFDSFIVNAIKKAEQKNNLISALYAVVAFLESDLDVHELTKQVHSSLSYVVSILIIALGVSTILLILVVPTFKELFEGFGAELPMETKFFIALGDYYGVILLVLILTIFFGTILWYRIAFYLPILGKLFHLTAISHFLHVSSFILQQGGSMQEALEASSLSMRKNPRYSRALFEASQQVSLGKSTAETLKANKLFPAKVIHTLHVGENRPNFSLLLQQLAKIYRLKVNQSFEPRLRLLSVVLLVLMSCFIGSLVIAMYLPIFQLGEVI